VVKAEKSSVNYFTTSPQWPTLNERYIPLMELQAVTDLAGAVAEWLHRGETTTVKRCGMEDDLDAAWAVLDDLWRTTGRHHALAPLTDRARAMLTERWDAVSALAQELIEYRRVEGERVAEIINRARSR
jgi:hypothetical protein